ncbi:MAG: DNA polymerase/3'-5' exonuclease PolX [Thermoprotei archaeon]
MDNARVSEIFEELADYLEIQGEESYKVAAYRKAAKNIRTSPKDIRSLWLSGALKDIPGVGPAIEKKISEIMETGSLSLLEETRKKTPKGLVELMTVPFVGPKTARELYMKYGIADKASLIKELNSGSLVERGFSEKTAKKILDAVRKLGASASRMLLIEALDAGYSLIDVLSKDSGFRFQIAGSTRRGSETVGDIDLIALPLEEGKDLLSLRPVLTKGRIVVSGRDKLTWINDSGIQFDFRLASEEDFGAMMQYFTGSKDHNVQLRTLAQGHGLKLNEYGLFTQSGERVAGKTEEEIYLKLGLKFIEPELREGAGEIEAAEKGTLPKLVDQSSILGDFHVHSNWSDGRDSMEAMVQECRKLGYRFMVFTDHSQGEKIANGLSEERVKKQSQEISRLQNAYPDIRIYHGAEVSILRGGRLDYDDVVLKIFDYVVASLHRRFTDDPDVLTDAVAAAVENRYVDTLGHPTGRLLGRRPEYPLQMDRLIQRIAKAGKKMELNGQPRRMDLPPIYARRAKDNGVTLVACSDAHSIGELYNMQFAVILARRAWVDSDRLYNAHLFEPRR